MLCKSFHVFAIVQYRCPKKYYLFCCIYRSIGDCISYPGFYYRKNKQLMISKQVGFKTYYITHIVILRYPSQYIYIYMNICSFWITIYINIEYPLNPFPDTLRNPDTLTKFLLLECTIYFQSYSYLCSQQGIYLFFILMLAANIPIE